MVSFDTPQSKAIKRLFDAYGTLDMKNVEPLISKDYRFESLPESTDLPVQTKESHLKMSQDVTYRELIEAPGKVVAHITPVFSTVSGATYKYDTVVIYTLVEEDGELKILHCKDFGNPQHRDTFIAGTAKAAAERAAA